MFSGSISNTAVESVCVCVCVTLYVNMNMSMDVMRKSREFEMGKFNVMIKKTKYSLRRVRHNIGTLHWQIVP